MRKMLALLVVCTILAGYIPPAFAGGWQRTQRRVRKAHKKWLKQQADFWKKFDAEMAELEARMDDRAKKGSQPRSGVCKK